MSIVFPAEWHKQAFVQLTWPHFDTDFAYMYTEAIDCFKNIALEISKRQQLLIVCKDITTVQKELGGIDFSNITFVVCDSNDVWARDHGGITVFKDGKPCVYDFKFNGWGQKFEAIKDSAITKQLFEAGVFKNYDYKDLNSFVFEGGGIESNGDGVLLTTEECLLSKFRNPSHSKSEIESFLKEQFGAHTVLWLQNGYLAGDDTDSHIDTLARFTNPNTIVYVQCADKTDEHYNALQAMEKELLSFADFNSIPLPMTPAIFDEDGDRIPATYANFLIINSAVLLPIYNCETDTEAIRIMKSVFPNKEIVPIDCNALIKQHGSLHCVTMQYPLSEKV